MNRSVALMLAFALLLSACATQEKPVQDTEKAVMAAEHPPVRMEIIQSWSGDFPVAELKRLPEGQRSSRLGYLGTAAAFAPVWAAFRPGEPVPAVDFGKHLVLFHRNVDFYNRTHIVKATLREGVAEVLAAETMSAIPIDAKVAMALAVIPRAGVKAIQSGQTRVSVNPE